MEVVEENSAEHVNGAACDGCEWRQCEFIHLLSCKETLWDFLCMHGIVLADKLCGKCGKTCRFDMRRLQFRCDRSVKNLPCDYIVSATKNTWFERSHLNLEIICLFTMLWCTLNGPKLAILQGECCIGRSSVIDWASFCQEVCIHWLLKQKMTPIGGPGSVVEVTEAKFGDGKQGKGRRLSETYFFSGVERDTNNCFLVKVDDREPVTLIELVKRCILPRSSLTSDCWKPYNRLGHDGYNHLVTNHKLKFVDPPTGHTNNNSNNSSTPAHTDDQMWRQIRQMIPKEGRRAQHMIGYIAEFVFRRAYPDYRKRIHAMFHAISCLYQP